MIWKALFSAAPILAHILSALAAPTLDSQLSSQSPGKYVFAHFMVGIVKDYQLSDWKEDMTAAQAIGIDAFALNCASIDSYTPTQLALAYEAAEQVNFKVFISFDFAYWTNGDTAKITEYMKQYAGHPAQMQYKGAAVVSTFVGDSFNWDAVRQGTPHPIYALPNLQDPAEATTGPAKSADGAFSWLAWPTDGGNSIIPGPMTTVWDDRFVHFLAGKTYMAPVSPWFSTHFNVKNWVFVCENLPTLRWEQMLSLQPDLIEIISWNDYGESHYIGPYSAHHSDDGSSQWAADMPHDGWRNLFKPYISAYKSGAKSPTVEADEVVYWYRPTPKGVVCTGDTLSAPMGAHMLSDSIFVATMLTSPATLTVQSGNNAPVSIDVPAGIVTSSVAMGVGGQSFKVTRNGQTILSGQGGLAVKNSCVYYNFNVFVGSIGGVNGVSNSIGAYDPEPDSFQVNTQPEGTEIPSKLGPRTPCLMPATPEPQGLRGSAYDTLDTNAGARTMAFTHTAIPMANSIASIEKFGRDNPTRPRQTVLRYLEELFVPFLHLLVLDTTVENATKTDDGQWKLTLRRRNVQHGTSNAPRDYWWEEQFDALVVASGHFTVPSLPNIEGLIETSAEFPDKFEHSKSWRSPDSYVNKRVVIVGGGISAADLVEDLHQIVKGPLYVSRRGNVGFLEDAWRLPNVVDKSIISRISPAAGGTVEFQDGTSINFDKIIFATGYKLSYPFLPFEAVTPQNRLDGFYQHIFRIGDPSLAIIGQVRAAISFRIYEYQAVAVSRFLAGRSQDLPSIAAQDEWVEQRLQYKGPTELFHEIMPDFVEYYGWLREFAGCAEGKPTEYLLPEFEENWVQSDIEILLAKKQHWVALRDKNRALDYEQLAKTGVNSSISR
ncbi:uncharacterized protein N7500_006299 [Penicillium coprophilum]|uniref:uncharacterized protein n=1 Tax=Penicillium coprophilum TaxID=36646 RepID=UPI00239B3A4E|nr:uncharacterized protein N7500_006299 [Penicillium coprophilum]KAJ5164469.1 hypothetical protein N7500_006299 [Penicillium coprophilum]